jgi:general secretion pathway protein J
LCVSSSNKGFTLLEVLIAVVMLGILTAALYGSYFAVVRARDRAAEGMEARRELGMTLDLLRREIASSLYKAEDNKRLRFLVEDRDNFGKPASILELTTLSPPSGQPLRESGIATVRYWLVEKEKKYILARSEQDSFSEAAPAVAYPQMERISGFLVECYDGSKWLKSWNTSLGQPRPTMVRITVQFEEDGKAVEFSVLSTPQVAK